MLGSPIKFAHRRIKRHAADKDGPIIDHRLRRVVHPLDDLIIGSVRLRIYQQILEQTPIERIETQLASKLRLRQLGSDGLSEPLPRGDGTEWSTRGSDNCFSTDAADA